MDKPDGEGWRLYISKRDKELKYWARKSDRDHFLGIDVVKNCWDVTIGRGEKISIFPKLFLDDFYDVIDG